MLGKYKYLIRIFITKNSFHSNNHIIIRPLSAQTAVNVAPKSSSCPYQAEGNSRRTDEEWLNAKPYEEIPGPGKVSFAMSFFPGGYLHKCSLIEMHQKLRKKYGQIFRIPGTLGTLDNVFTYNVDDFERVYRTEGIYPRRYPIETFEYYRKKIRPDVFQGIGGLVTEQGKDWYDIRAKVNPILMKPETVRYHLSGIDVIAEEFIERIKKIRDPNTLQVPKPFTEDIKRWAFESICLIALDTRLNMIKTDIPDPNAKRLSEALTKFFQLTFELDILPSLWKYYGTPKFKELMAVYDVMTDITTNYINSSIERFKLENAKEGRPAKSALEKLYQVDKRIAIVMAIDMLMAGMDTTSAAFTTLLYHIATNPEKQERLRKEVLDLLPNKDTPITKENTKNMPYLRACFKESLRVMAITPGNFRETTQDLILSGYRIPKGTGILMGVMVSSNDEKYFQRSVEYLPERWLKLGEDACPSAKTNHPFVYLPFGFGPRTCIGKRVAEMEIETLIMRILRNYRVSWPNEYSLKYVSNLINSPTGDMEFKFEDI